MATMPRFTIMREDVSHVYAREYGVARDSATIIAAILDIGQDNRTLVLSDDEDGLWVLTADVTIPSNIWLSIPPGVTVTGTAALTIQGGLMALRSNWYQSTGPLTWIGGEGELHLTRLKGGSSSLQQLVLPGVPLALTEGGTGARTAPLARTNLGLTIGTNVQAYDATLQALAGLPVTADTLPYFTGVDQSALTPFTPYMRTLLDDPDAPTARVTLGLGALAPLSLVTTPYVADKNITYAKLQDLGAFRLLGNGTGVPATAQDIVVGAGLQLSGGILSLTGGYIAGTGQDGTVALWSGAGSQTYDPNLVWDRTAHRLGINVAVPAYGLDMVGSVQLTGTIRFTQTTGRKIVLYPETYGLSIEPSELRLFTAQGARLTLGGMSEGPVYTPLVYVDTATARVGINSTTPGATLSVAGTTHLYGATTVNLGVLTVPGMGSGNSNVVGYGFQAPDYAPGTANRVGFYSLINAGTNCWGVLHAGTAASKFGGSLEVAGVVGIAGGPDGSWNLRNYGSTYLASLNVGGNTALANVTTARLGVPYAVDGNYWLRSGNALIDAITCLGKIVAASFGYGYDPPRWPLDINGQAFASQLGVYYGPDAAAAEGIDFRTRYAHIDSLGVGYAANGSYSIRSGNIWCDAIGAGYAGGSGYHLRAGETYVDHLGVGTPPYGGWNIAANSILAWSNIQANSSIYSVGGMSCGGELMTAATLRADGNVSLRGTNTGIAGWADGRWNLTVWGTSYHSGSTHFAQVIGVGYAPDGNYWLRCGSSYFDSVICAGAQTTYAGHTVYGGIYVPSGNVQIGAGGGGLRCDGQNEGVKYTNVGSTGGDNYSNWVAFGWDGNVRVRVDSSQVGYITLNGSDERMKCAVQDDVPGLDAVLALRAISFAWDQTKRALPFPAGRHYGLLAQQARPHVPLAIGEMQDDDHWLTLDYQALVPVLIQAVQDLDQRMEARMRALEARLAALEAA